MLIEHVVPKSLVLRSSESIQFALARINENSRRLVFCVAEDGVLEGVMTDGDFRRWVLQANPIDLSRPVIEAANRSFVSAPKDASLEHIESKWSDRIAVLPLLDSRGRLMGVAWRETPPIMIEHRKVAEDEPAFIIAEIGNNHNGSLDLARQLIDHAVAAGADCAKFQMRDMGSVYAASANTDSEDLGTEYTLDLLRRFQLNADELHQAFDYCHERGIIPMCTPWDSVSLARLEEVGLGAYKIASADLTNHDLVRAVAKTGKPIIMSTGMSTESEIREAVTILKNAAVPFVLLNCNSTYPTPMQDVNLSYMNRLKEIGDCIVGYSGHERGIEVPMAAISMGAKVIEKHITVDRGMEGNDHRVSLLPDEFRMMVTSIRNIEAAIGNVEPRKLTQGERLNRENLAKSLIASRDIPAGTVIERRHLDVRSPGRGLQPNRMKDLIGKSLTRDMSAGDFFFPSDLEGKALTPRHYAFSRPWGIPVRYHDLNDLTAEVMPDLVEIHFSYRDLDLDPADFLDGPLPCRLVVHAPELFAGDHLMDLSTPDDAYRIRSQNELQRVIDRVRELKPYFPATERPPIIINAGGFTATEFMPVSDRAARYDRIAECLGSADTDGVEIIPQTMPPYPWHFGGQQFHNLFMDPDEIAAFSEKHGSGICLDISHSALACNRFDWSLHEFIRKVGPYTRHLHIVDAKGHHDEGLQIGEGDIDFGAVGEDLDRFAAGATFIPEIWQGHKNGGEGFWYALDRLERAFGGKS